MKLSTLAEHYPMRVVRDCDFKGFAPLHYRREGQLSVLCDRSYLKFLPSVHPVGIITTPELAEAIHSHIGLALVNSPLVALHAIHDYLARFTDFYGPQSENQVSPSAEVSPGAMIGEKNVTIGGCSKIEGRASVSERCRLGSGVTIRHGSVIGAEGFAFHELNGERIHTLHSGGVEIGDNVEVQANSVVCRSTYGGNTVIGDSTKISCLVNISHNAGIGRRCKISSSACIMGGAQLGDDVWVGPNAVISNNVIVGDGAFISLGTIVVRDVPRGAVVTGNFGMPHSTFLTEYRRKLRAGRSN